MYGTELQHCREMHDLVQRVVLHTFNKVAVAHGAAKACWWQARFLGVLSALTRVTIIQCL